ncbi:MAG TPA: hypothetical protein VK465_00875 [Fibrobacteria bacterium]|nr:hypothetical protein [Fibrobacteria bacterium]
MQQDSHRPDKPAAHASLKSAFLSDPATPSPRPLPETRKASRGAASDSLTAKMQDYRNWWNLPRTRSRKTHT